MTRRPSFSFGAGMALGLVALLGLGWLLWTDDPGPPSSPEASPEAQNASVADASSAEGTIEQAPTPAKPKVEPATQQQKADAPAESAKVRPHPPSPERRQLQRERALLDQARRALQRQNVEELREALQRFRAIRSTDQFDDWFEALNIIVDCLDVGGADAKAAGKRFVQKQRGSTMRRSVRKYCDV